MPWSKHKIKYSKRLLGYKLQHISMEYILNDDYNTGLSHAKL